MSEGPDDKMTPLEQVKMVAKSAKAAFTSDGCTMSPDFTFRQCCVQHDMDYANPHIPRSFADDRMRRCIQSEGYVVLPWVYWLAVRVFGRGFRYGTNPEAPE